MSGLVPGAAAFVLSAGLASAGEAPALPREGADPWAAFSKSGTVAAPQASEEERKALEHFKAAEAKFWKQDYGGALWDADRAIGLQPDNPRHYNLKAAALNKLKMFREAESAASKSIRLHEENPDAYLSLALAQLNLGRNSDAIFNASRAIEQKPREAQAYAIRAFAYEAEGQEAFKKLDIERAALIDRQAFGPYLVVLQEGGRLFAPAQKPRPAAPGQSPPWSEELSVAALGAGILVVGCLAALGVVYWSRLSAPPVAAASRPPAAESDPRGLLAGKYELTRVIGKGGMGHVWEAKDTTLNRAVAVKQMTEEMGSLGSQARGYYVQEARTVASLRHPHIIGIYEILDLPSGVYLVFEMASGKTAQHILAEKRRLSLSAVRDILRPVCDALDFAHGKGFVHRDLKPANIMIAPQGFVKVMDFGIARRVHQRIDEPGTFTTPIPDLKGIPVDKTQTIVGTPAYMAPEAERGIVTSVSDVYSLGVCFYELLTGAQPFNSKEPSARWSRAFKRPSVSVPGLPADADALAHDALDPNPETRIPSAREFLNRLERLPAARMEDS